MLEILDGARRDDHLLPRHAHGPEASVRDNHGQELRGQPTAGHAKKGFERITPKSASREDKEDQEQDDLENQHPERTRSPLEVGLGGGPESRPAT